MNGFTEHQTSIFNIVKDAGYVGTQEQLFDMMQEQSYFDSTFSLVRQAGFEGDERDFIFLAGVAPKKKRFSAIGRVLYGIRIWCRRWSFRCSNGQYYCAFRKGGRSVKIGITTRGSSG